MTSDVTREGVRGAVAGRNALTGSPQTTGLHRNRGRGEERMVPDPTFTSYYGLPVIKEPVWHSPDIPLYLFSGGLAAGSSLLGAGAQLTGRHALATRSKVAALLGVGVSGAALVHDLGVPSRFLNMLRVFKPTSPMSVGAWLLGAFGPLSGAAAFSAVTNKLPRVGAAATIGAAAVAPAVAAYTAALLSDTAVPAWHDAYHDLPFLFVGSAALAAGGLGLVTSPTGQASPARLMSTMGWIAEAAATESMQHRLGMVAEPYEQGKAGRWMRAGKVLAMAGAIGAWPGRRSRVLSMLSGAAMVCGSMCTRFGVFHAGMQSASDPKYTVVPQRQRLEARGGDGDLGARS